MKTVRDLKDFINNLPDDMPLVIYREDSGYRNELHPHISNMRKERNYELNGISYSYEVMVASKNGIPCLVFC